MNSDESFSKLDRENFDNFDLKKLTQVFKIYGERLPKSKIDITLIFSDGLRRITTESAYIEDIETETERGNNLDILEIRCSQYSKNAVSGRRSMTFQVYVYDDNSFGVHSYVNSSGSQDDIDWARSSQHIMFKLIKAWKSLNNNISRSSETFNKEMNAGRTESIGKINISGKANVVIDGQQINRHQGEVASKNSMLSKIIWYVVVPLGVAVLAGAIIYYLGLNGGPQ